MGSHERLGVLGGTFDPIHNGHVFAAAAMRAQLELDRIIMPVAAQPWQKADRDLAPASDRLAMVSAAVADLAGVEASDVEIARGGSTFTIDTLRSLAAPDRELFLAVGADAAAGLSSWRDADAIRALATLVIFPRTDVVVELMPGWRVVEVPIPRLDISSSEIRERVRAGRPIDGLVPAVVIRMIADRRLYTSAVMTPTDRPRA